MDNRSFIGLGDAWLGKKSGGPLRNVGSCSVIQLGHTEDKKDQQNYGRTGGKLNTVSRLTGVSLAITMQSLIAENLALAVRGTSADLTSATVTDETRAAYPGALIRLNGGNIDPTSVVVVDAVDGTTTYVEGADYTITSAGIIAAADGAIAAAIVAPALSVDVKISYSSGAASVIEALVASDDEYILVVDGINEADSGKSSVIDMWRLKFGLAKNIDAIGDDFANLELTAELLADASKGSGQSAFYRITYAA